MNNPHQALIEEKVAEIFDTEYIGGKQPNLNKKFVTQTLQATIDTVSMIVREEEAVEYNKIIDTVLEGERERVLPYIERIRLDVDVIICECGGKYKDSDLDLSVQELEEALTPTN